jgi:hypothetical protein
MGDAAQFNAFLEISSGSGAKQGAGVNLQKTLFVTAAISICSPHHINCTHSFQFTVFFAAKQ